MTSLPQTERLLDELAELFGADPELDVVVRKDATVARLLELNEQGELASRRVLCFATHAIYPTAGGDTLQEPAIVLSPGDESASDGLFWASQVRQLKLDSEFVLLTACFTGSPAGKSVGVPLSGLAESFFYAGAKCMLVSNWPVDVNATESLIKALFSETYARETLAEALQRAMSSMRMEGRARGWSHPMYWAGFSIIGDGGIGVVRITGTGNVGQGL